MSVWLKETSNKESITCASYNYNGTEVVASYSDEDIYLFDATLAIDTTDVLHRYKGHRNSDTGLARCDSTAHVV